MKKLSIIITIVILTSIFGNSFVYAEDIKYKMMNEIPSGEFKTLFGWESGEVQDKDGSIFTAHAVFNGQISDYKNNLRLDESDKSVSYGGGFFTVVPHEEAGFYIKLSTGRYMTINYETGVPLLHHTTTVSNDTIWQIRKTQENRFQIYQPCDDGYYYIVRNEFGERDMLLKHSDDVVDKHDTSDFFMFASYPECDHDFTEFLEYKTAPTCTADGVGIFKCKHCDETTEKVCEGTKLSHDFTEFVEYKTAPTCTADGIGIFKCEHCDKITEKVCEGTKLSHDFTEFVEYKTEPTCTADGVGIFKCEHCDETTEKVCEGTKLSHDFTEFVEYKTEPTCESDGVGIFKCEHCDETTEKVCEGTKLSHDFTEFVEYKTAPTCEADGVGIFKCKHCDETTEKVCEGTKLSHDFTEFVEYKTAPTCTADGVGIFKCKHCDETTEKVCEGTKLSHDFTEFVEYKTAPTCTADGVGIFKCKHCDETTEKICDGTKLLPEFKETISYKNKSNSSDGTLTFKSEGDFDEFEELYLDNKLVAKTNYTVTEGSTIITLNADYVKNMVAGEYEFSLEFIDGFSTVTVEFEPVATSQNDDENSTTIKTENPKTDATKQSENILMIVVVAFMFKKARKILLSK